MDSPPQLFYYYYDEKIRGVPILLARQCIFNWFHDSVFKTSFVCLSEMIEELASRGGTKIGM